MAKYEVVLAPAAIRFVLSLPGEERKDLADALRQELDKGPNVEKEYHFELEGTSYTATPLSFNACIVIYRPMTSNELMRLRKEQGRRVLQGGFYVIDILSSTAAHGDPRLNDIIQPDQADRLSNAVQNDANESTVRQLRVDELRRILE